MESFLRRQRRLYVKPWLNKFDAWKHVSYGDTTVYFKKHLDGGGSDFGQDFIPFLRMHEMPPQHRVFEWCAGAAFIGFSLLAHGFAETLCLADINPLAVEACRRTVRHNGLDDRVSVYVSDNLTDIPQSEQWDLVVGSPPHLADDFIGDLRTYDGDWHIHRGFFANVARFLKPGGVIVLQENNCGSTIETFAPMIEAGGLQTVFVSECRPQRTSYHRFYFIGVMRRGDSLPHWVSALSE